MREAFPNDHRERYLIFDHDTKFGLEVEAAISAVGLSSAQISVRSPWQNGVAERWVGSCRRDLLDHIIPLNERHLKRLLSEYVRYYHEDRTHLGLEKDTPILRGKIKGRLLLSGAEKATLAEIAYRIGRKALAEVAAVATPETLLAW